MTIPAASDWCPACEETCTDHASVCTTCGTTLTQPPPPRQRSTASSGGDNVRIFPTLMEAMPELRQANRDLTVTIRRIRQQIQETEEQQGRLFQELQQTREEWQQAPAEWLDPAASNSSSRATSKNYLDNLPRTLLQDHSSILLQPLVAFQTQQSEPWTIEGTTGDFGIPLPSNPFEVQGEVVLASPRTGRGGSLSADCLAQIQCSTKPVLLYFDRGDITFVAKSIIAQKAGAVACLIGNHVADPWPYIMKDSKKEAASCDLRIPTILIPKHAGVKLKALGTQQLLAHLDISQTTQGDCVVCTESFAKGATVVRLPECGHLFHEACALPWLQNHNTCMYCRRELPTDDEDYERERRRTRRTHAGSAPRQNTEFNDFYG